MHITKTEGPGSGTRLAAIAGVLRTRCAASSISSRLGSKLAS